MSSEFVLVCFLLSALLAGVANTYIDAHKQKKN